MSEYSNGPLQDLISTANDNILQAEEQGFEARIYFKWTCEACGERVTADEPNIIYSSASHTDCEVTPGHVTNTEEIGGNYVFMQAQTPEGNEMLRDMDHDAMIGSVRVKLQ